MISFSFLDGLPKFNTVLAICWQPHADTTVLHMIFTYMHEHSAVIFDAERR
ncbi:hypothetical protein ACCUM_4320 [Candidatus Accumulibacter phosphatis]|uniref:Uncharacterized protein n=1 Tax=Candidatus Accumulibacter phosphatis TaxID=327160 RepID=A0A5S4EM57_9PROT|nr:hypothetical protein ACCUM_4320 [Candidatus Accumulibacter phosphatis]